MSDNRFKTWHIARTIFFAIWLLCVITTVIMAVMPADYMPTQPGADKMLHMLTFCLLTIWPTMTFDKPLHILGAAGFLIAAGISIELLQMLSPTRNTELMDIVFDTIGIGAGLIIGYLFRESYQSLVPQEPAPLSH